MISTLLSLSRFIGVQILSREGIQDLCGQLGADTVLGYWHWGGGDVSLASCSLLNAFVFAFYVP